MLWEKRSEYWCSFFLRGGNLEVNISASMPFCFIIVCFFHDYFVWLCVGSCQKMADLSGMRRLLHQFGCGSEHNESECGEFVWANCFSTSCQCIRVQQLCMCASKRTFETHNICSFTLFKQQQKTATQVTVWVGIVSPGKKTQLTAAHKQEAGSDAWLGWGRNPR